MKGLVSYSDSTKDEYIINDISGNSSTRPIDFFYSVTRKCRFCSATMKLVYHSDAPLAVFGDDNNYEHNKVFECPKCMWWDYTHTYVCGGPTGWWNDFEIRKTRGIVKRFDIDPVDAPIRALISETNKRPEDLNRIDPGKLELLVGAVFKEFYSCEVLHCGRTGDGGIDLMMINGESPILIQVKQRKKQRSTEPISAVRDFLGAMMIHGSNRGIYVSTAHRFSKNTDTAIKTIIESGRVDLFKLVNFDAMVSILGLANTYQEKPWARHVTRLQSEGGGNFNLLVDVFGVHPSREKRWANIGNPWLGIPGKPGIRPRR